MTQHVKRAHELGISEQLQRFVALFLKWNAKINLSAVSSEFELDEHLVDSLEIVSYIRDVRRVIDVGSGGGLPVVVAAIALPDVQFVALEPIHKKHAFLRTAARELGLVNLSAFAERAEDHVDRDYDAAVSRATFDLRDWLAQGLDLVHDGGFVLGFEATPRTDLPPHERHPYELAGKQRSIILVRKPPT